MKKLQPILNLVSSILLEQVSVALQLDDNDRLGVETGLSRLILKTPDAEGLTIEDVKVGIDELKLPSPDEPGVSLTFRLDSLTLQFAPEFWGRAAELAKEKLVARLGMLLDRIHLRGLKVKLDLSPDKIVDTEVWMEHFEMTLSSRPVLTVDDLHLLHENMAIKEKNKKLALKNSRLTIFKLATRVSEELLNRGVDVARKKIPATVQSIDFDLHYERMLVNAKVSVLPTIPVELTFQADSNLFTVYIVKIGLGGPAGWMARNAVNTAVNTFAKNKPEIRVLGDRLAINPWGKIPVPIVCRLSRFAVAERCIVVEFAAPAEIPERMRRVDLPALPAPKEEPAGDDTSEAEIITRPAPDESAPEATLPPLP